MSFLKKDVYEYVYVCVIGVGVVALFLFLGVRGFLPFGIRVAHSVEGVGTGMAVIRESGEVTFGAKSAFLAHTTESVRVVRVSGAVRKAGLLEYYTGQDGLITETFSAQSHAGAVLATFPFLGLLVKALAHPIGVMAFLGVPFVMVVMYGLQVLLFRVRSTQGNGLSALHYQAKQ
jgi:hypothetical protein